MCWFRIFLKNLFMICVCLKNGSNNDVREEQDIYLFLYAAFFLFWSLLLIHEQREKKFVHNSLRHFFFFIHCFQHFLINRVEFLIKRFERDKREWLSDENKFKQFDNLSHTSCYHIWACIFSLFMLKSLIMIKACVLHTHIHT